MVDSATLSNKVHSSGIIEFLGAEAKDNDVKEFFVENIIETMKLCKKGDVSQLVDSVTAFLSDYDLTVGDEKKLNSICSSLLEYYVTALEQTKQAGKGKQQQQQASKKKGKKNQQNKKDEDEKPSPGAGARKKGQREELDNGDQKPSSKSTNAAQQKKSADVDVDEELEAVDQEDSKPQPQAKGGKKPQKQTEAPAKKGPSKKPDSEDDEIDKQDIEADGSDEEEPKRQPAKGKKGTPQQSKKQAPASAFALLSDEMDGDEEQPEDEVQAQPKKSSKKNRNKAAKQKAAAASSPETSTKGKAAQSQSKEAAEEEAEEEAPEPKKEASSPTPEPTKEAIVDSSEPVESPEPVKSKEATAAPQQDQSTSKSKSKSTSKQPEKQPEPEQKQYQVTTSVQYFDQYEEDRKGSDSLSNDIKIEKFDISFPGKELFKDATLALSHGRKYGLVAPNGTGKSTLLKHIAERDGLFAGIPKHFLILYVEQEVVGDDTSALDSVVQSDVERTKLLEEEQRLMSEDNEDLDAGQRLAYIHARLDAIEAYSAEARASSILTGLQFTEEMKQKATKDFSGGWRMRIALARALFRRPTLLLLDEPTNHLDLLAVIWLETYLKKWKNTLLVVSHDQDFLNSVCTDVIHIHQQKLHYYKGNYDAFKKLFVEKVAQERKDYEKALKILNQAKNQKSKGEAGKKGMDRAAQNIKVMRNKQLKGGKKRGDDNEPLTAKQQLELKRPEKDYTVAFHFPDPEKLSIPVIQVLDASFGYSPDKLLFRDLNFGLDQESRVALVGPNGTGKSTLLKLLQGKLEPTSGTITRNRKLVIGRFSQHFVDQLNYNQTPVEYLATQFPEYDGKSQQLRQMLGRFGLTGKTQIQPINTLSGGQKSRVVFAELSMREPHILFLDEPTNHLDIESVDALAEALNEFQGGLILVSHDSRLISEVCSTLWVCGMDQTVTEYEGDFEDYRAELVEEFERREAEEEEERKKKEEERRKKREAEMRERETKKQQKASHH